MKKLIYIIAVQFLLCNFLVGQNYVSVNCSGVDNLYGPALETEATNINILVKELSEGKVNEFKVHGLGIYPILAYSDTYQGLEFASNAIASEFKSSTDYYLAFVKEFVLGDNGDIGDVRRIVNKVLLKLPTESPFDKITPTQQEIIRIKVQDKVLSLLKDGQGSNIEAEKEAMKVFAAELTNVINNPNQTPDFGILGADEYTITLSQDNFECADGESFTYNGGDITFSEFTKMKSANGIIDPKNAFVEFGSDQDFTFHLIMSSNFCDSYNITFSNAHSTFLSSESKIISMMHFEINYEEPDESKLYVFNASNLLISEAEAFIDQKFDDALASHIHDYGGGIAFAGDDQHEKALNPKYGYENWVTKAGLTNDSIYDFGEATGAGLLDGFLGSIDFIFTLIKGSGNFVINSWTEIATYSFEVFQYGVKHGSFTKCIEKVYGDAKDKLIAFKETIKKVYEFATSNLENLFSNIYCGIEAWFEKITSTTRELGYFVGTVAFEVILGFFSGGSSVALKGSKILPKLANKLGDLKDNAHNFVKNTMEASASVAKKAKCKILGTGCFVKDTPVQVANKSYIQTQSRFKVSKGKSLAIAAALPMITVPIQEVQLLDYAVSHKTVNAGYGLTASLDNDLFLNLIDKDPYTSDEQRARDKYKINDVDWHEVILEEVFGSSTAKFALHQDWITQKGYQNNAIVRLELPEMGISGPFKITSIKHIIPQKRPVDEDNFDDLGYQPITAIFTHISDQVHNVKLDNKESIEVTFHHPIYSLTESDWKLAGELQIGEKVLSKYGETIVTRLDKKVSRETVYNLEVKDFHNFLVGNSGIVVHNGCVSGDPSCLNAFKTLLSNYRKNLD